jgi:hypothetical protein
VDLTWHGGTQPPLVVPAAYSPRVTGGHPTTRAPPGLRCAPTPATGGPNDHPRGAATERSRGGATERSRGGATERSRGGATDRPRAAPPTTPVAPHAPGEWREHGWGLAGRPSLHGRLAG